MALVFYQILDQSAIYLALGRFIVTYQADTPLDDPFAGSARDMRHRHRQIGTIMTAETDFQADEDDDDGAPVPIGARNYITPEGLDRLKAERHKLWTVDRPEVVRVVEWAAGNGDRSENGDYIYGKKRLREIDRRLRFLDKRIAAAESVDPRRQTRRDQVFFGATVTYARADDSEETVTIVGIDEIDTEPGRISWVSPVARALLKAMVGDTVTLRSPTGNEVLEVLRIDYPVLTR
jgi:transcription elongation factor GreB